ncbi:MATE family efflux transporter [Paenibacillus athensensis]|uniref:MATE family efflux transporter n=1 Tax=Paenibacillus athensensis TaxID=1967502 RepID=A0A4Y8Q1T0_9BACL|nr:MATE family efflux transporter [Paenibacillus athensensis]MCD1258316.1 MATE family efflux transporter [Paenibacillus athensensis]
MSQVRRMTLFGLVWPLMIELFLQFMIGTADTLMVSRISDDAVAVVGISNQLFQAVIVLFALISGGAGIVISQKLGAGKPGEAKRVAAMAFSLTMVLGVLVSLAMFFGADVCVRLLQVPPELHAMTREYVMIVGSGTVVMSAVMTLGGIVRSTGNTKGPMLVALGMNVVHIFGNYVFIFGSFGLPKLGLFGVCLSTVGSRTLAMLVLYLIFRKSFASLMQLRDFVRFDFPLLKEVLKVGFPMALGSMSWTVSQVVIFSMVATMGAEQLAARTYLNTMESFSFTAGWAFAMAVQIQVAHLYGAGEMNKAYRAAFNALLWGQLVVVGNTVLLFAFGRHILGTFTGNADIIALGVGILAMDLVLQPLKMVNMPINNALNAIGDTQYVMKISMFSMWLVAVAGTYVFGLKLGWLLHGVYIAMIADEAVRGALGLRRWMARGRLPRETKTDAGTNHGAAAQL